MPEPTKTASAPRDIMRDRKSTRLNSSHSQISYAGFCLKKKTHVLELPLAVGTFVAAQLAQEPRITIRSSDATTFGADAEVAIPLEALVPNGAAVEYHVARDLLTRDPRRRWAAYVAGALVVLARERGLTIQHGVFFFLWSGDPRDLHSFPTRRSSD